MEKVERVFRFDWYILYAYITTLDMCNPYKFVKERLRKQPLRRNLARNVSQNHVKDYGSMF